MRTARRGCTSPRGSAPSPRPGCARLSSKEGRPSTPPATPDRCCCGRCSLGRPTSAPAEEEARARSCLCTARCLASCSPPSAASTTPRCGARCSARRRRRRRRRRRPGRGAARRRRSPRRAGNGWWWRREEARLGRARRGKRLCREGLWDRGVEEERKRGGAPVSAGAGLGGVRRLYRTGAMSGGGVERFVWEFEWERGPCFIGSSSLCK
mmetsp:Transcript_32832/g.100042  ORF Transcript_32832/g.100042 Transcript_32832/m.100042 type:complete len:210 (+) Transcript_32832:1360-1989(+)